MIKKIAFILTIIAAVAIGAGNIVANADDGDNTDNLSEAVEEMLDEIDFSEFEKYIDELGGITDVVPDVKTMIRSAIYGESFFGFDDIGSFILSGLTAGLKEKLPLFISIFILAIACSVINILKSDRLGGGVYEISYFAIYSALVCAITATAFSAITLASETMNKLGKAMEGIFPIMLAVMAATGNEKSIAVFNPALVFVSDYIIILFKTVIFPIVGAILALSVVSNINKSVKLKGMIGFFTGVIKWTIGLTISVFSIFLTVKGITAGAFDGIYARAVKYTVNSGVPIVGGMLKDGLDVIRACATLLKNALGMVSVFIIFGILIKPLLEIAALSLALKLIGALSEPIGDGRPTEFINSAVSAINYATAAFIIVALAFILTIIVALCSVQAVT